MKKYILLLVSFLSLSFCLRAQEQVVDNPSWTIDDNVYSVKYVLSEPGYVELYLSLDGGESFQGPLTGMGDLGNVRHTGFKTIL